MNEPRIFVITLLALRTDLEDTQVTGAAGASTILTVQTTQEAAEAEGWQSVQATYPPADGWFGHEITAFELPPVLNTDGYSVAFHIATAGGMA
jgi:hypothetical protein